MQSLLLLVTYEGGNHAAWFSPRGQRAAKEPSLKGGLWKKFHVYTQILLTQGPTKVSTETGELCQSGEYHTVSDYRVVFIRPWLYPMIGGSLFDGEPIQEDRQWHHLHPELIEVTVTTGHKIPRTTIPWSGFCIWFTPRAPTPVLYANNCCNGRLQRGNSSTSAHFGGGRQVNNERYISYSLHDKCHKVLIGSEGDKCIVNRSWQYWQIYNGIPKICSCSVF